MGYAVSRAARTLVSLPVPAPAAPTPAPVDAKVSDLRRSLPIPPGQPCLRTRQSPGASRQSTVEGRAAEPTAHAVTLERMEDSICPSYSTGSIGEVEEADSSAPMSATLPALVSG